MKYRRTMPSSGKKELFPVMISFDEMVMMRYVCVCEHFAVHITYHVEYIWFTFKFDYKLTLQEKAIKYA